LPPIFYSAATRSTIPWAWGSYKTNKRLIYSSIFWLSFWWINFSNIRGRKKTIEKIYWLEWIFIILSWSYKTMWIGSSNDIFFTKL